MSKRGKFAHCAVLVKQIRYGMRVFWELRLLPDGNTPCVLAYAHGAYVS